MVSINITQVYDSTIGHEGPFVTLEDCTTMIDKHNFGFLGTEHILLFFIGFLCFIIGEFLQSYESKVKNDPRMGVLQHKIYDALMLTMLRMHKICFIGGMGFYLYKVFIV